MNKVILSGHITRDIEIRITPSGKKAGKMIVAKNITKEKAIFIEVILWDKLAEWYSDFKKGDKAIVMGYLNQERWRDGAGKWREKTNIVAERVFRVPKKGTKQAETDDNIDDFNPEAFDDGGLDY